MVRLCMIFICVALFGFFFFKQKTAYEMRISDWSSDVCSSDLLRTPATAFLVRQRLGRLALGGNLRPDFLPALAVRCVLVWCARVLVLRPHVAVEAVHHRLRPAIRSLAAGFRCGLGRLA